uniref:DUF5641 domain-containing protein n=1 Tax=Heterorhabditis bacteriophora TaxID=37862 RepID=A0A1I7X1H5_HETBA
MDMLILVDDLGFQRPWGLENVPCQESILEEARTAYSQFWTDYLPTLIHRRKRWEKADPRTHPNLLFIFHISLRNVTLIFSDFSFFPFIVPTSLLFCMQGQ